MNRKAFKKILLSLLVVMMLSFSCNGFATADLKTMGTTTISPRQIDSVTITFTSSSEKSAKFSVNALTSKPATYITVKVTLQSSAPNENKFKDVAGIDPIIKTVYNAKSISASGNFPVTSYLDYRIKVQITEDSSGFDTTHTKYKNL